MVSVKNVGACSLIAIEYKKSIWEKRDTSCLSSFTEENSFEI